VAVSQSSVPARASPIGDEISPALPAGQLHSSLVQPGSEVTTTFLDRSLSKVPQPNSSSIEQLSLVEAGMRRHVDGDTDLMVRNDLQTRAGHNDPPSPFDLQGSWDTPEWPVTEEDIFNLDQHYDFVRSEQS